MQTDASMLWENATKSLLHSVALKIVVIRTNDRFAWPQNLRMYIYVFIHKIKT